MPKKKYSYGPETLKHYKALDRHFDLYRDVCFGTRVHEMHWDDADNRWVLHTNHQDRMRPGSRPWPSGRSAAPSAATAAPPAETSPPTPRPAICWAGLRR